MQTATAYMSTLRDVQCILAFANAVMNLMIRKVFSLKCLAYGQTFSMCTVFFFPCPLRVWSSRATCIPKMQSTV